MGGGVELLKFLRDSVFMQGAHRPIRMHVARFGKDVNGVLLPQYVCGTEAICGGSDYEVWSVAASPSLVLKDFVGRPLALEFVTDQGALRRICGIVTNAIAGDCDGGVCAYKLRVRDALAVLDLNIRTRIFRKKSELDIVRTIIEEWRSSNAVLGAAFDLQLADGLRPSEYPAREFTMQYNESDAAFIRRLLRRRGISWFFVPESEKPEGAGPAHKIVLFDDAFRLKRSAAGSVRYHRGGATEESDTITHWSGVRSLTAGRAERFSWDYKYPFGRFAMATACRSGAQQGDAGDALAVSLEDFQIAAPHLGDDADDFRRLGELFVGRSELASKCFVAHGTVRAFQAGEYFTLTGHPEIDTHKANEREFVITAMTISIKNNFPGEVTDKLNQLFRRSRWESDIDIGNSADIGTGQSRCRCTITAVRRTVAIVPAFDSRTDVPSPPVQTAIVIGPEGEEVHCDPLGRVLVCFPGAHSESKRQSYSVYVDDELGNSTWLRVASNWAGDGPGSGRQCGTLGLPRIGTEVLIGFMNADPDKPFIIGQLYNGQAEPPALSKNGSLPGNRYLSGIKSREVKGGRANQLRFDDSPGRINAQLASDQGTSQLNLGFLVHPLSEGHGETRGQGAELRSDHAVAVRGGEGALISAQQSEGANGEQLDCAELTGLMDELHKLSNQLSELAEKHAQDQPSGEAMVELLVRLKKLAQGGQALVALSGPAGIVAGSGESIAVGAQLDLDLMSGGNARLIAAGHLLLRSALDVSVFANELGIRLVAAKGPVILQAQEDAIDILAKKVLQLISSTDWINIKAREGVRIYGGGSELEISANGIKGYTGGKHEMHAADHQTFPKQSREAQFPGELTHYEICLPCLLKAAKAHAALVEVK